MHAPSNGSERCDTAAGTGRGTIAVLVGCMFSGKTTELLRRLDRKSPASTLVFKHIIDDRYQLDAVVSHGGKATPATRVGSSDEILQHVHNGIETVAVDEGHFFDAPLVEAARGLGSRGISVIITSLDVDSWGKPFPVARRLWEIADEPIVLRASCARCGRVADRTQRLTPIVDARMVGGPESYEPRCRKCWTPPREPPLKTRRRRRF